MNKTELVEEIMRLAGEIEEILNIIRTAEENESDYRMPMEELRRRLMHWKTSNSMLSKMDINITLMTEEKNILAGYASGLQFAVTEMAKRQR